MKTTDLKLNNHEIWYVCPACGKEFDRRLFGNECPACGHKYVSVKREIATVIFVIIVCIAAFVFFGFATSCASTKYHVRNRNNHNLQLEVQYEHSTPSGVDPLRIWRNWDMRPHGHWPFNFLQ